MHNFDGCAMLQRLNVWTSIRLFWRGATDNGSRVQFGCGHNISIEVDNQKIKVAVFPMEGVIGGELAEQIRRQIEDKIHEIVK